MADTTAPRRLPRGRHGLSREEVSADQRLRMLLAMAEATADKGFVGTSVADVLKRAGVSRETFYQHFSSKQDCFLHAFDAAGELVVAGMTPALGAEGTPIERFEAAFAAYLDQLGSEPAFARMFLVEVYAAGPEALARRLALQRRIVDALVELLDADDDAGRFTCELLVAGVSALVTGPLVAGDLDALRALHAPVVAFVRRTLTPRDAPRDL